jgi:mannose-6-phosphate isomerase
MLYPLCFKPIPQERIWGGRNLETLYGKQLPPGVRIGESWEISDRPGAESEISNGPLAGKTLHWVVQHHPRELLGSARPLKGRFPLLVKILDAEEKLSLQVHPPAERAEVLCGEPKTEIWYVAKAQPGAALYAGLKPDVSRESFERAIHDGSVADCFHQVEVKAGDSMFLPSGRVHAIGAGLVIFEIQQNSDTTYRVFDWNRKDASGKPRDLHIRESLECINFNDFAPEPIREEKGVFAEASMHIQTLVDDPLFSVEAVTSAAASQIQYAGGVARIVGVVSGKVQVIHPGHAIALRPGEFCLLPASLDEARLETTGSAKFLVARPGG